LVLRREGSGVVFEPVEKEEQDGKTKKRWKSLVGFEISHTAPGALAEALMVFKTGGLNLTSINSRPGGVKTWQYIFFVEFEGHRDDQSVRQALLKLESVTERCRCYGSFVNRSSIHP